MTEIDTNDTTHRGQPAGMMLPLSFPEAALAVEILDDAVSMMKRKLAKSPKRHGMRFELATLIAVKERMVAAMPLDLRADLALADTAPAAP